MQCVLLLALVLVSVASTRQIFVPTLNDTDCGGQECPANSYCVRPLEWTMPQFCIPIGLDLNAPHWPMVPTMPAALPDVLFAAVIFTATAMGLIAVIQIVKFIFWIRQFV